MILQSKLITASNLERLADLIQSYLQHRDDSTPKNYELVIIDPEYFFKTDYADNFKVLIISYYKKISSPKNQKE